MPTDESSGQAPETGTGGANLAYTALRTAIVEGRMRPGDRLIEQRIAAELSLSRTPVREAVRMLVADGLVTAERHRGAVVRVLSREDVLDLYELRARLESYAAERAALRRTDEDLAAITAAVDAFGAATTRTDVDELDRIRLLTAANRQVHGAIVAAGRHERLAHLLASTVDAPLMFEVLRTFSPRELARSHMFHELLREAIARREPTRAAALMHEHVMLGRDQVLGDFTGEGDGDADSGGASAADPDRSTEQSPGRSRRRPRPGA